MKKESRDKKESGFGAYLGEGRLRAGLSLNEVAAKLFISGKILQHLEDENHSELLEPVFVAGFVRSYADFLGLRVERALLLYKESRRQWENCREEARRRARRKRYLREWIGGGVATFALILLFTLSGLGLIHVFILDKKAPAGERLCTERIFSEKKAPVPPPLHLEVLFSETSSFKIMVDGNMPRLFTMKPGERLEFDAEKTYNIMIGNATGVRMFLNGSQVSVSGTGGQPVSLFLP